MATDIHGDPDRHILENLDMDSHVLHQSQH